MGIALGIDFSWMFVGFRRQVGAKLASTIHNTSIQKGIKIVMRTKKHLDASWRHLGAVLAGWGERRAEATGNLWAPLIFNFQRNQSPDNKAKADYPHTPNAQKRGGG